MGKKDRRAEIPDKKARKNAEKAKEEEKEKKEIPKIKGCHVSIDVCGGCIRPKDPVPEANSGNGVQMACSNHHCPFAKTQSVHKDCFQKLTDKIVSMLLRTGSSSWTDEQRVENAWRKKGLTFVGKYITCPCGHGTQTLEDSENRWSRIGEVVLDPQAYETKREEKIKKALKHEPKPANSNLPKKLNCTFGGYDQAMLAKRLERQEYEREDRLAREEKKAARRREDPAAASAPIQFPTPPPVDDDGFTTIGKDGRAQKMAAAPPAAVDRKGIRPLQSIVVPPLGNATPSPQAGNNRAERGRSISTCSATSWLTSSSALPPPPAAAPQRQQKTTPKTVERIERKRGGMRSAAKGGKENRNGGPKKQRSFAMLSGSEDEEDEEEEEEAPQLQQKQQGLRAVLDEFHSYSGIGYWSPTEVKEINGHLDIFKDDSALFFCSVTQRRLRGPTIITELTPVTAWMFTTQAMNFKKPDIPPGTQLTLQEYYAIFHNHEVKHLDDPIVFCKDGTQAVLECVVMSTLDVEQ